MDLSALGFYVFLALLGALVIVWNMFIILSKNAAWKRKLWRAAIVFGTPLFGVAITALMLFVAHAPLGIITFLPVLAVIALINLKAVKFCDRCGVTLHNSSWWRPMHYCSHWGAELHTQP
jgi:hypothetical protein